MSITQALEYTADTAMIPLTWTGEIKGGLVYGDGGDDTFNVGSTGVLKDGATIYANEGNDTINFDGTAENGAQIQGNEGYDTINIKSGAIVDNSYVYGDSENESRIFDIGNEINIDGTVQNYSSVYGGAGVDTVNINGTVEDSYINTRSGNDFVNINSGAHISGGLGINTGDGDDVITINGGKVENTEIDGGSGFDTLKIAGNSIDFSQVRNIEKLDMTNGEKTNLNLSSSDVQNILRDSDKDKLRIDGDGDDTLKLTDGGWSNQGASSSIGYTLYSNGTTTIEVQDQIHVL